MKIHKFNPYRYSHQNGEWDINEININDVPVVDEMEVGDTFLHFTTKSNIDSIIANGLSAQAPGHYGTPGVYCYNLSVMKKFWQNTLTIPEAQDEMVAIIFSANPDAFIYCIDECISIQDANRRHIDIPITEYEVIGYLEALKMFQW